jgi:hypothetical protein
MLSKLIILIHVGEGGIIFLSAPAMRCHTLADIAEKTHWESLGKVEDRPLPTADCAIGNAFVILPSCLGPYISYFPNR